MKLARIRISRELFLAAIPLPDETLLLSARLVDAQTIELEVEHPALLDVKLTEGEQPPIITPTFTTDPKVEEAFRLLQERVSIASLFEEWGQYVEPDAEAGSHRPS